MVNCFSRTVVHDHDQQVARDKEKNVHFDGDGQAQKQGGEGWSLVQQAENAGVEKKHGNGIVEEPENVDGVDSFGKDQKGIVVEGQLCCSIDSKDKGQIDQIDESKNTLPHEDVCAMMGELVQESENVEVTGRISRDEQERTRERERAENKQGQRLVNCSCHGETLHYRACVTSYLHVVSFAVEERGDLLHVGGPIDFRVYRPNMRADMHEAKGIVVMHDLHGTRLMMTAFSAASAIHSINNSSHGFFSKMDRSEPLELIMESFMLKSVLSRIS